MGPKKKTYGPYLGEMKKLAKPIELVGRVIKYKPEVVKINEKKSKQKGGTTAIVLEGNGSPYKTIVLQYDGFFRELNIYLSKEGTNVIPNDDDIDFKSIISLDRFEDMIKHKNPFDKNYLFRLSVIRNTINKLVDQLFKICSKFCIGYSTENNMSTISKEQLKEQLKEKINKIVNPDDISKINESW